MNAPQSSPTAWWAGNVYEGLDHDLEPLQRVQMRGYDTLGTVVTVLDKEVTVVLDNGHMAVDMPARFEPIGEMDPVLRLVEWQVPDEDRDGHFVGVASYVAPGIDAVVDTLNAAQRARGADVRLPAFVPAEDEPAHFVIEHEGGGEHECALYAWHPDVDDPEKLVLHRLEDPDHDSRRPLRVTSISVEDMIGRTVLNPNGVGFLITDVRYVPEHDDVVFEVRGPLGDDADEGDEDGEPPEGAITSLRGWTLL